MGDSKPSIQVNITIDGSTTHKKVKVDSFILGRHADCDVNVLHPQVSRQHLKVTVREDRFFVEDVGSSNGTFLNAKRLVPKQEVEISQQDILQFGEDGPTIQIQFEEKKAHTALSKLSKLESLISPILHKNDKEPKNAIDEKALPAMHVEKPVRPALPSSIPSLPDAPKKGLPATIVADPLSQPLSAQRGPQPEQIIEANKQAAIILQNAEVQAEKKAKEAHKHAMEIEERAEVFYKERLKAASADTDRLFEETRQETSKLLQETRAQTQNMREQAEQDARHLRKSAEEKAAQLLEEAKIQGESLKAKRLSEADDIIEKKGQELLKATHEKIEKEKNEALKNIDSLKAQSSRLREATTAAEAEYKELEKKLSELKKQSKHDFEEADLKKANIEKYRSEEKELHKKIENMKKETHEQELAQQKLKSEYEKLNITISSMKSDKEEKEKEINSQLQALKNKVNEEKDALAKAEADRMNQLKLETAEALKKFEQELIDEIASRKIQITKEVLLQIEAKCPGIALSDEWKNNQSDLNQIIQDIFGSADQASAKKVVDSKGKSRFSRRTREKAFSMTLGLCMGVLFFAVGQEVAKKVTGASPIERMVATAMDTAKSELEKRKYNPPQVSELKGTYVDAVIFTRDFSNLYNDPKYQEAWNKAATLYLLKTWRLDEDKATKALAASAALVKDLAERKEKIHPDFVKSGLEKMREAEKETVARIKDELGGEVRFESFKKYEKRFFENYDRTPASE